MEYLFLLWPLSGIATLLYRLNGQDTWRNILSDPVIYFLLFFATIGGPFTWLGLRDPED